MVNTDKRSETKTRRHTKKILEHLRNVLIRSGKKGGEGRHFCRNRRGGGYKQVVHLTVEKGDHMDGTLDGTRGNRDGRQNKNGIDKTSSYDAPKLDVLMKLRKRIIEPN